MKYINQFFFLFASTLENSKVDNKEYTEVDHMTWDMQESRKRMKAEMEKYQLETLRKQMILKNRYEHFLS